MRRLIVGLVVWVWVISVPSTAQTQKLHFGHFLEGVGWDPSQQIEPATLVFYDVIYDTLVTTDFAGRIVPRLATDWMYLDDARLTLVFELRDDVVFSDGIPFNAEVAKANIERAKTGGSILVREELATIGTIDVLDDYRLRVTLLRHDDFLLPHLAGFSGMMVSPAAFETIDEMPVGSGPWQLNLETSTDDHFFYERFEDHWQNDAIQIDSIEMVIRDVDILLDELEAGILDIIEIPPEFAGNFVGEDTAYTVYTVDSNLYLLAFLDREGERVPELGNREVRCAISQTIDRESYTNRFGGGLLNLMTAIPPSSWYGFAPDAPIYPFDIAGAQDRLVTSGIEEKPKIAIAAPATQEANLEFIAKNIEQLGIQVNAVPIADDDFRTEAFSGEYSMALITVEPSHFVLFVQQYVLSSGRFNPLNAFNDQIEALVQEIRNIPLAESEDGWQAVSRGINEQCYFIPLSFGSFVVIGQPEVGGVQTRFRVDGFVDFRQMFIREAAD